MDDFRSHVYIVTDADGRVIQIEGEYSLSNIYNLDKAILIEEGEPCDRLNHAQNAYLNKPLRTDDGICQYKYTDGEIVERTETEIEADRKALIQGLHKHYVVVGDNNRIIDGWSSGTDPERDAEDAVILRYSTSREFFLIDELNPELFTYDGIPMYVLWNGEAKKLSREGVQNDREMAGVKPYAQLIRENKLLSARLQAQADREEFIEDCIAELAIQMYAE